MALELVTAPTVEPLSLVEAKAHLRVSHDHEDALIELLIKAATAHVDGKDGFLGRALVQQTWDLVIDEFPANEVRIPLPPLQEVLFIEYDDGDGIIQTLATDQYTVDVVSEPGWIVPGSSGWPTTFDGINAVRIRFVAGYESTADSPPDLAGNVPAAIKAALLLTIGHLYANRETVLAGAGVSAIQLPWGIDHLLRPYRVRLGMA